METKICIRCKKEKPIDEFRMAWKGAYRKNQCSTCVSRTYTSKFKLDMLAAFDFKCSCCGERHPQFLTLDHVNNDGGQHRRMLADVAIHAQARREKFDKLKWDCLCMNCNFAKGHFGVCPHKSGLTPEAELERLRGDIARMGRRHYKSPSRFTGGYDERRMQLSRRVLKPCPFCGQEFGTNEMTRHKRQVHAKEMAAKRAEILSAGRVRQKDA